MRAIVDIDAIDTVIFRDGRSFTQADAEASAYTSVFPPYPPSVVGAIRLSVATQMGFGGGAPWPVKVLGDGVDWQASEQLGDTLKFSAPFVTRGDELLFPTPLNVLRDTKTERLYRLQPGRREFVCDLDNPARLPEIANPPSDGSSGLDTLNDTFLNADALGAVLDNRPIENIVPIYSKELWQREPRVGIGLDAANRTAVKGQLYAAGHVRPIQVIGLRVEVEGLGLDNIARRLQVFGGEHRLSEVRITAGAIALPHAPKIDGGRYMVVAVSPLLLPCAPQPNAEIAGLPGKVVSACTEKPVRVGGWNGRTRRPIPMRQALPAGSVIFMKTEGDPVEQLHGTKIGESTEWGFGQILVGRWDEV